MTYKVDIVVNFSVEAAKQIEDEYFDFVYIDADHSYKGVTNDLEAWWSKVKKRGMIAGHDYMNWELLGPENTSVILNTKDAVDDFVFKYNKLNNFFIIDKNEVPGFFIIK